MELSAIKVCVLFGVTFMLPQLLKTIYFLKWETDRIQEDVTEDWKLDPVIGHVVRKPEDP